MRFLKILNIELPNWITNIFRPPTKNLAKDCFSFIQETISEHLLYAIFKARRWGYNQTRQGAYLPLLMVAFFRTVRLAPSYPASPVTWAREGREPEKVRPRTERSSLIALPRVVQGLIKSHSLSVVLDCYGVCFEGYGGGSQPKMPSFIASRHD